MRSLVLSPLFVLKNHLTIFFDFGDVGVKPLDGHACRTLRPIGAHTNVEVVLPLFEKTSAAAFGEQPLCLGDVFFRSPLKHLQLPLRAPGNSAHNHCRFHAAQIAGVWHAHRFDVLDDISAAIDVNSLWKTSKNFLGLCRCQSQGYGLCAAQSRHQFRIECVEIDRLILHIEHLYFFSGRVISVNSASTKAQYSSLLWNLGLYSSLIFLAIFPSSTSSLAAKAAR